MNTCIWKLSKADNNKETRQFPLKKMEGRIAQISLCWVNDTWWSFELEQGHKSSSSRFDTDPVLQSLSGWKNFHKPQPW